MARERIFCMLTLADPVTIYERPGVIVATFGGTDNPRARTDFAQKHGTELTGIVYPPANANGEGFKRIAKHFFDRRANADGAIVPPGGAIGILSRDCPIVVLENSYKPAVVVLHAGRPALSRLENDNVTIIERGLEAVTHGRAEEAHYVTAYITAGICATCFEHTGEDAEQYLAPFRRHHPQAIGKRGCLDLKLVIRRELQQGGISAERIFDDGLCTREHPALYSHRNGDTLSNMAVVIQP